MGIILNTKLKMRFFDAALLAATCYAEQTFMANDPAPTPPSPPSTWNAITTPLNFTQVDTIGSFNVAFDGQTKGVPDPPALNGDVVFTIAGQATHPITIERLQFVCYLFGALVYNEAYEPKDDAGTVVDKNAHPGQIWTGNVSFAVPAVAPPTDYHIEIIGLDAADANLFAITTAFKFWVF